MNKEIKSCRICQNPNLIKIIDLGEQVLTGFFPLEGEIVDKAPLVLVKCYDKNAEKCCGLVQLQHTYDLKVMYGKNYGYRSSLNNSMAQHLQNKVKEILARRIHLTREDLIVDIGSNDGTTLNNYPENIATLIGVDPTAKYFSKYYKEHIHVIEDFFSEKRIRESFPKQKAKIITSFSMFYDLENPQDFTNEVANLLDEEGVWVLEQSYLGSMLNQNSFDTICHEHLEYYSLKQIQWLFDKASLKIIDVTFNDINGGSFSIIAAKKQSKLSSNMENIRNAFAWEETLKLNEYFTYEKFIKRINGLKHQLLQKILSIHAEGKKIYGIGASTKGNVLLQYYNLNAQLIPKIGEVNNDKIGRFTPGSNIKIAKEEDILAESPDYLLILPWHFKSFFIKNPRFSNVKLLFPLPNLEVI